MGFLHLVRMAKTRNPIKMLVGEPLVKQSLKSGRRLKDNIKMDLRET
jgi:hypothetical protein